VIQALTAWGPAAIWAAVLFLLSELPGDTVGSGWGINDKVAHLGLYLVLGASVAWAASRSRRIPGAIFILIGVTYGALDEWHQAFVPGRDPSSADWLADAAGVLAGFFLLRTFLVSRLKGAHGKRNRNV